jgi:TPR repeat protein
VASKVFISYRREDAEYIAPQIHEFLSEQMGDHNVFIDVDSIPYGADFREHLLQSLEVCEVIVAIMGPLWAPRLSNPGDFVRLELETALELGIEVIPVFVSGIKAVPGDQLPPSLHSLRFRNGLTYRPGRERRDDLQEIYRAIRAVEHRRTAPATFARQGQADPETVFQEGLGATQQGRHEDAARLYRLAAQQGHAGAQNSLGVAYARGEGVPADASEAVSWYVKAANQGDPHAQYNLGMAMLKGGDVPKNAMQAFRLIEASAKQGLASAQEQTAGMLEYGNGVMPDRRMAAYWYKLAADQGSRRAAYEHERLTIVERTGNNPDQCLIAGREALANGWFPDAEELLLRAVQGGLATAYYPLAEVYDRVIFDHELRAAERDPKAVAVKYYVLAARSFRWDAESYCTLGFKIGQLAKTRQDREAAVACYQQAAALGSVEAMTELGEIYMAGKLVTQDFAEGARWVLRAAQAGDAESIGSAAFIYAYGMGMEQDFSLAEYWAQRAVEVGNDQGRDVLSQIKNPITRLSLKMQGKLKMAEFALKYSGD